MKIITLTLSTLALSLAAQVAPAATPELMESRCNDDIINHGDRLQIPERWEWSKKWHSAKWTNTVARLYRYYQEDLNSWTDPNALGPYYPIYVSENLQTTWVAPKDRNAPEASPPFTWKIILCQGGCLLADQLILFSDGYFAASDAMNLRKAELVTLDPQATAEALEFTVTPVESYRTDMQSSPHNEYISITTDAGTTLKVTPTHPLIDGNGVMVRANQLEVGGSLLHISGKVHRIVKKTESGVDERVINVQPATKNETSNVYVVGGYLSGSSSQQDRDLSEINRILFREQLPSELFVD